MIETSSASPDAVRVGSLEPSVVAAWTSSAIASDRPGGIVSSSHGSIRVGDSVGLIRTLLPVFGDFLADLPIAKIAQIIEEYGLTDPILPMLFAGLRLAS